MEYEVVSPNNIFLPPRSPSYNWWQADLS